MSQAIMLGQKLFVDIVRATNLAHLNHFTGDHPYVQCEVKHLDRRERATKAATKPVTVGDTLNPVWNERLEIQPWQPGEDLELTVYDKGLIGAKTEGKVMLPSSNFYPQGFNGYLPISGMPHALLQVAVQPAGGATSTYGGATSTYGGATSAYGGATSTYGGATSAYGGATGACGVSTAYTSAVAPVTYSTGTPAAAPMTYTAGTPMTTMMAPSTSYTQSNAMPVTYSAAAPTTAYSACTPMTTAPTTAYSTSTPMISAPTTTYSASTPAMPVQMQAYASPMQTYASPPSPTQTYATPMQTYASPPSPTYVQQPQPYAVQGGQTYGAGGTYGTGAYKLAVSIVQAQGLKHLNHFTGDHPYVVCEVKHAAHRERKTKVETKPVTVGDTTNPVWNETLELEPWHQGEPLEFSIYDKGLIGSKTEGKATLPAEYFYNNPNGFYGVLPISDLPHASLQVGVRLVGPSAITVEANSGLFAPKTTTEEPVVTQVMSQEGFVTQTVTSKKKSKKIKVGSKKKSGCC